MGLPEPSPDRTALVTGASSGIGAHIARRLAARGYGLVLVARRRERLEELAAELDHTGVRIEVVPADLTDAVARAELPQKVDDLGLEVAVLVNNAGLSTTGPVHRAEVDDELRMLEVDVVALTDLTTRFLAPMVERGRGAVLNVASTAAFQPIPGQAGYSACKAYVLSYTRSLSGELQGRGVTVTALCPGPVRTEFAEVAGFVEGATQSLPEFMWESPEDVAEAGVAALEAGHTVVIPGVANRVTAALATLTPKQLLVPIMARMHPAMQD